MEKISAITSILNLISSLWSTIVGRRNAKPNGSIITIKDNITKGNGGDGIHVEYKS